MITIVRKEGMKVFVIIEMDAVVVLFLLEQETGVARFVAVVRARKEGVIIRTRSNLPNMQLMQTHRLAVKPNRDQMDLNRVITQKIVPLRLAVSDDLARVIAKTPITIKPIIEEQRLDLQRPNKTLAIPH